MLARLATFGRGALDLLLPPECLTCDAPVVSYAGSAAVFCVDCFRAVSAVGSACCDRCGVPMPGGRAGVCAVCQAEPPLWGRARAALVYDAHSRRAILPFKHADRPELAKSLAGLMAAAGRELLAAADVLVPVPLHRGRLFLRGYNQSALLTRELARQTGRVAVPDGLVRLRATAALAEKTASERAREMRGAIGVRPRRRGVIAGARVLLVDDVMTSGATARACCQALIAAGALGVDVLVAGRVPHPGQERDSR